MNMAVKTLAWFGLATLVWLGVIWVRVARERRSLVRTRPLWED